MVLPLLLAAGVQAGGAVIGGILGSNAADKAKDAQETAQQNAQQARERAAQRTQQLQAPGVAAYGAGLNALTERLGLPTAGVASQATQGGAFNPSEYLSANPDVAAEFSRLSPNNLKNNLGVSTPEEFAQWHYNQYGQYEGRAGSPSALVQSAPPAEAVQPTPTNALAGSYGNTADPTWTAPPAFSFNIDDFKDNPAYKWALEQGSGQITANAAKTGALQSGAALKALQDRGQTTGYNFFNQERNQAYGQYTDDWNRARSTYETDRNYLTDRWDQGTNDLFKYMSVGQNALNTTTNSINGLGADAAQGALNLGEAQAGNAIAQGNIWGGVVNNLAGAASSAISGWPTGKAGVVTKSKTQR